MPDFTIVETAETPYLYVSGTSPMAPEAVSEAMGAAFHKVMGAMQADGIAPAGPALSVYHDYDPEVMRFRAGFVVARAALDHAGGGVEGDMLPAGRALHFVHVGPYATLRDDYALMMDHLAREGLTLGAPSWELYLDDPETVPEAELRTAVYCALA